MRKTVAGPQPRTAAVPQAVARTLEADLVVEIQKFEAIVAKPGFEMLFLGAALHRHEVACNGLVAVDRPGVGRKHHVGQLRLRLDNFDVGVPAQPVAERLPLRLGAIQVQGIVVPPPSTG